jgi:hypothetical protein
MSDLLADYREWRDSREERIGTHSGRCHMWHPVCMIVRLARELERTRAALVAVATQDGTLSVSGGRLFVDVDGVEELAFDLAPPTHAIPDEGSVQE